MIWHFLWNFKIEKKGSDAGHNGLKNIQEVLQTQDLQDCVSGFLDFPKENK